MKTIQKLEIQRHDKIMKGKITKIAREIFKNLKQGARGVEKVPGGK